MIKRLFLLLFLLLLLGGGAAYFLVPWNDVLERKIISFLHERGIENVAFDIDTVGLHSATIKDISIGAENPLVLQSFTVQYDPRELARGNLQDISLSGLTVKLIQTKEGWSVAGTEGILPKKEKKGAGLALSDIVDLLPFTKVEIRDSILDIAGTGVQTSLPFSLTLTKTPETILDMTVNAANLTSAASDVALGVIHITAKPDGNRDWAGSWSLESLDFGEALPVPVLAASGSLSYVGSVLSVKGSADDAAKTHKATFDMLVDTADPAKNKITVSSVSFPFKNGNVSSKNIVVPFDRKKNVTVNLNVRKVSLDDLMQTLTQGRVSATGTVSGSVPVIIRPDGSYTLGEGSLKADDKGLLQMPGEMIPGDTEQMTLV
ncbi:MAG TPA: YdbH domain-containing protein, partial [Micavibrio sp.]|nr:YdbH domain-containing protein [Micavibrio sp.]